MSDAPREDVRRLDALTGTWDTVATHPAMPGEEVPGETTFEWLAGGHFLICRWRNEHELFPDGIEVIGADGDAITMRYFDSRGYARVYTVSVEDGVWRIALQRADEEWEQRYEGRFEDDGNTIAGLWYLSHDDGATWEPDLQITYRRRS